MLFRTSHHSAMLEIELTRRNIPFVKFGGLKFIEAAHVKDMLAVLRWAENPADRVTGFRVIQLLPGLGPATAAKVLDAMAGRRPSRRGTSAARQDDGIGARAAVIAAVHEQAPSGGEFGWCGRGSAHSRSVTRRHVRGRTRKLRASPRLPSRGNS